MRQRASQRRDQETPQERYLTKPHCQLRLVVIFYRDVRQSDLRRRALQHCAQETAEERYLSKEYLIS